MTTRKQLYNGWFMAALSAVMLVCGICIEKKVNDTWLNSSLLEGRSRGIVSFIELSKKVFDTGNRDLMRRFLEDSYTRREQLGKGADNEDFLVFWTNWETDADEAMRARRGLSPSAPIDVFNVIPWDLEAPYGRPYEDGHALSSQILNGEGYIWARMIE